MLSERLRYAPLEPAHLDVMHGLVVDAYVRRYLMDGQVFPRDWTADRIAESQDLFRRRGVGLWLVHEQQSGEVVGFCGFLVFPEQHADPQLLYALLERFSGQGYATEMARTCILEARRHPGFAEIISAADEVNTRSLRILAKLGFRRFTTMPGAFGEIHLLRLDKSAAQT